MENDAFTNSFLKNSSFTIENASCTEPSEIQVLENGAISVLNDSIIKNPYAGECHIRVREVDLRETRKALKSLKKQPVWPEVMLAVSTTLLGCSGGALASGVEVSSSLGALFYFFFPIAGAVGLTCYFFSRNNQNHSVQSVIEQALNRLPDPDSDDRE